VSLEVAPSNLGPVEDPGRRARYVAEAERMAERHDRVETL